MPQMSPDEFPPVLPELQDHEDRERVRAARAAIEERARVLARLDAYPAAVGDAPEWHDEPGV